MARPKKKGVDYFPHDCITGKTIFTLEQKFGNDGYAFWFKLLEFLGTKEGHFLNCNDLEDMEFLQAKTRLDEVMVHDILNLLANLNAIDRELWQKRVVWSQRFVDGISDVYVNRRVEIPVKPDFYTVSTDENLSEALFSEKSTSKSTQSKVKESKVNNINGCSDVKTNDMPKKKITDEIPLPFPGQEFEDKWTEWTQYRRERRLGAYVPTGLKRTFSKLIADSGNDCKIAIQIIDESISNGWQGLFPLKQNLNGSNKQNTSSAGKKIEFDQP